jgi:hypothetical protein
MQKTIWKFTIPKPKHDSPVVSIKMPVNAEILTVQMQNDIPQIWAECNPKAEREERQFVVMGTGWPNAEVVDLDEDFTYIGTVQDGAFVWHIYELGGPEPGGEEEGGEEEGDEDAPESDAEEIADELSARIDKAVKIGLDIGTVDGSHHKQWGIDQMLRKLLAGDYKKALPDDWDTGTAP